MNESELKQFLEKYKNDIEYFRPENELNSIILYSRIWDETIKIDLHKLTKITEKEILIMLCNGKNVEKMTRVTGYFAKIATWNKGKLAELKDRYRIENKVQTLHERREKNE